MANLPFLSNLSTNAQALNLILVTPKKNIGYIPKNSNAQANAPTLPPILFHYEGEQTATMDSDITDHFVEDNTSFEDQIALKPETITTHGFIGELNDVAPEILANAKFFAEKLVALNGYLPQISVSAQLAYDQAFQLYQVAQASAATAISAWSSVNNAIGSPTSNAPINTGVVSPINPTGLAAFSNQNKQQVIFSQFYAHWKNRTLFTVQTPWAIFDNMAIKTLRAVQDEETRMITDFELTFKAIRLVDSIIKSNFVLNGAQGRALTQSSAKVTSSQSLVTSPLSFSGELQNV